MNVSTKAVVQVLFQLLALSSATNPSESGLLRPIGGWRQAGEPGGRPSAVNCTWSNFTQKVDHFGHFQGTFPQRLCTYSKWWRPGSVGGGFRASETAPGPIFFYTGNESPVEEYVNNTGLMWELAESFGALIVFVEHRYEPLSHPALCGNGTQQCFAYCTTAQALADFVAIIADLRAKHTERAPVVAFGGSYGGMLAGWLRMKYPDVVDGAIAASAPIWQLAGTVLRETLDMQAVAITRGVSAAGGATDQCRDNLQAAWPLLQQVGLTAQGLQLLSGSVKACSTLASAEALTSWAQRPYFFMAEGNYPFPSTYITFSVTEGRAFPLPAWPMRVACERGLNRDFGIKRTGSVRDINVTYELGGIRVDVDWANATGNGANLTSSQIRESGVLELAAAVADAAGVWWNLTMDQQCYDIAGDRTPLEDAAASGGGATSSAAEPRRRRALNADEALGCPACPPCDGCPPCPVSFCDWEDQEPCDFQGALSKGFSWDGVCCNDALSQIDATGLGRDIFWPPQVPNRNYTVESVVGPRGITPGGCARSDGLRGGPLVTDRWSSWMEAYYGGRNVSHHRNIVWSNGALDPWSGQGVYPPGGGPDGPMVQNVSADGSQISLILDLGAHHLDLMFTDERNPPCFDEARAIEERYMRTWCQEAYDTAHATF